MKKSSIIFPAWTTPRTIQANDIGFTKVNLPYGWLGCMSPFPINYQGLRFRTNEALFQWLRFDGHPDVQADILAQKSPMMAKEVARTNRHLRGIGPKWDEDPSDINRMRLCLLLKVEQYPELLHLLRRTGDAMLIEDCTTHPWESAEFWGAVRRGNEWHGQSALGCLWMEMRAETSNKGKINLQ